MPVLKGLASEKPLMSKAQIVEPAEVMPRAEANAARKSARGRLLIIAILNLAKQIRRIVDAEVQAVAVAEFRIPAALARPGRR